MADAFNRRRALTIMAAVAGLPLIPFAGRAHAAIAPVTWQGQALGAPATLVLNHHDQAEAEALVARVVAEVRRLEDIFSLYRADSVLSELNRTGALAAPPADLVDLLGHCRTAWETTGGAFDPTVQPLWMLYARHFQALGADPSGPEGRTLTQALSMVAFDSVRFNGDRIAFAKAGMALTLNGIAQGYITDKVVALLRDAGVTSSLVEMGESRAIGAKADGSPWRIGLAETETGERVDTILPVIDKAVATSSASGFHFDPSGRFGHILDPRQGAVPPLYRRMSVVAPSATAADAFSTAFSLMKEEDIRAVAAATPGMTVDLSTADGQHVRFGRTL
ncbi:FAD:protein FMN transferase [Ciceribacter ferrooxidans]|uniref:FAD:protein FMN transferase n=1 Tax=Ciceribacter ferrooxidans TaxID=2509717 RepID=A0A4Q2TDG4_9HYPH|nr:FAD:protein FMN transferase [Ciceribacter ferrooxidans]RYC15315.1 FAD:protein FMN transferase [Ciceribacter ferrooxidans]